MILSRRPNDDDRRDGFTKWPFMTTHTWGEYPWGEWTLEVIQGFLIFDIFLVCHLIFIPRLFSRLFGAGSPFD